MSVEATLVTAPDEWDDVVEQDGRTSPFHRYEALSVMADHSGTDLYPFVGFKGQEPVGLFPVFSLSKGPLRAAMSPPPDFEVSYLGPVALNDAGTKQRKSERRNRRFVEAVLEEVDDRIAPHYTHVRSGFQYPDPRPMIWNGFEPTPRYTYLVDVTGDVEDLFMSFSSDVRRNVRRAREDDRAAIEEGDVDDVGRILRRVRARHEDQGVHYTVPVSFVRDLYRALPDGTVRTYTCTVGGDLVGGLITVEGNGTLYRWQSVADLESDVPAADLLDWEMLERANERGVERVDLVGANNPRLCGYKAKFNPAVRTYYSLERSSLPLVVLRALYTRLR